MPLIYGPPGKTLLLKLGCALDGKTYANFRCAQVEGEMYILEVVKCVSVERYIQTQRVLGQVGP